MGINAGHDGLTGSGRAAAASFLTGGRPRGERAEDAGREHGRDANPEAGFALVMERGDGATAAPAASTVPAPVRGSVSLSASISDEALAPRAGGAATSGHPARGEEVPMDVRERAIEAMATPDAAIEPSSIFGGADVAAARHEIGQATPAAASSTAPSTATSNVAEPGAQVARPSSATAAGRSQDTAPASPARAEASGTATSDVPPAAVPTPTTGEAASDGGATDKTGLAAAGTEPERQVAQRVAGDTAPFRAAPAIWSATDSGGGVPAAAVVPVPLATSADHGAERVGPGPARAAVAAASAGSPSQAATAAKPNLAGLSAALPQVAGDADLEEQDEPGASDDGSSRADLLAPGASGGRADGARPIFAPPQLPSALRAEIAERVAALAAAGELPGEIRLRGPDDALIHIRVTADGDSLSLAFLSDRGETAELLRRQMDRLLDDLHALGYGDASFGFGGGGERGQAAQTLGERGATPALAADRTTAITAAPLPAPSRAPATAHLDIRL